MGGQLVDILGGLLASLVMLSDHQTQFMEFALAYRRRGCPAGQPYAVCWHRRCSLGNGCHYSWPDGLGQALRLRDHWDSDLADTSFQVLGEFERRDDRNGQIGLRWPWLSPTAQGYRRQSAPTHAYGNGLKYSTIVRP